MKFTEKRSDQIGVSIIITLVVLIIFLLALTFGWTSKADDYQSSITVTGEGRAFVVPDTAVFSYVVQAEAPTAKEAQQKITASTKKVVEALRAAGVEEADIKTQNYNVYPRYEYRTASVSIDNGSNRPIMPVGETRVLVGYEATQTDQVRVRKVEEAGDLLALTTDNGATSVSSVDFIVWDETAIQSEARKLAIEDAQAKADELADQLGVRLGDIKDFYENDGGQPSIMYDAKMEMIANDSSAGSSPEISLGENEILKTVSITFEIK